MAWYKALRNARVGKKRYAKGEVVELDAAALEGKADNFEACEAPGAEAKHAPAKPKSKKDEPKHEHVKAGTVHYSADKSSSWVDDKNKS